MKFCKLLFTLLFQVFIEFLQLDSSGLYWREKARWIKYEENVEPSGNWGRPFLSYVDCESLRHVRRLLGQGNFGLNNFLLMYWQTNIKFEF